jgi:hypothetical protein
MYDLVNDEVKFDRRSMEEVEIPGVASGRMMLHEPGKLALGC